MDATQTLPKGNGEPAHGEAARLLALWRLCRGRGEPVCLATVVHVEGSSYRKPGARMLIGPGGQRAGTLSGGCLEGEVTRKAWWLTENGSALERYQSSLDEDGGELPWGLGCGGTVWVLLERNPDAVLQTLARCADGEPGMVVSRLGFNPGTVAALPASLQNAVVAQLPDGLKAAVADAVARERSVWLDQDGQPQPAASEQVPAYFIEYLQAPPRLTIFGAGDDAQPLARFAEALGWHVTVADGRVQLLSRERFPEGAELRRLHYEGSGGSPLLCGIDGAALAAGPTPSLPSVETGANPGELAVVMTHSFEQDRALLGALLPRRLRYLGILGPRHRTLHLLQQVAPALGWSVERCLAGLRAPIGLDLGVRDPASIALSVVAELQATLAGRDVSVRRTASSAEDAHWLAS